MKELIQQFLSANAFAVAGASTNRNKFGNKVLRCYLQHHKTVYPVNPNEKMIENIRCCPTVADLPLEVESLSIVTPPNITENIVAAAIQKGIKHIWMQPGAESEKAIQRCHQQHINVIAQGPCILQILGFNEDN